MDGSLSSEEWGELRSLVHAEPSAEGWHALWGWFGVRLEVFRDERVMTFVAGNLSRWPDAVRVVPEPLWGSLLVGEPHAGLALCRVFRPTRINDPRWLEDHEGDDALWLYSGLPDMDEGDVPEAQAWIQSAIDEGTSCAYLPHLGASPALRHLTVLDLSGLADMSELAEDWGMDAEHCQVSAETLAALATSEHAVGLRVLRLDGCGLGDEHLQALASGDGLVGLEELSIEGGVYSAKALGALIEEQALPSLRELSVGASEVDWQVLEAATARFAMLRCLRASGVVFPLPFVGDAPIAGALEELELVLHPTSGELAARVLRGLAQRSWPESLRCVRFHGAQLPATALDAGAVAGFGALDELDLTGSFVDVAWGEAVLAQTSIQRVVVGAGESEDARILVSAPEITDGLQTPREGEAWFSWYHGEDVFRGLPVVTWSIGEAWSPPASPHVLRVMFDGGDMASVLPHAPDTTSANLSISGAAAYSGSEVADRDAFIARVQSGAYPNLRALTWQDCPYWVNEMSWVENTDLAPLLHALPDLEFFGVKGGMGLEFAGLRHEGLRALVVQTGGMRAITLEQIIHAHLPNLEALELWLGTPDYECEVELELLEPLLQNRHPETGEVLFPKLRQLGLCNTVLSNQIADALTRAPVMAQLHTLDLRYGTLKNPAFQALARSEAVRHLDRLLVARNYLSARAPLYRLAREGVSVQWGEQRELDYDYYVEVGE